MSKFCYPDDPKQDPKLPDDFVERGPIILEILDLDIDPIFSKMLNDTRYELPEPETRPDHFGRPGPVPDILEILDPEPDQNPIFLKF
uniref:Reverse transcriptase domain-containing protein n=1 Tax=Romanomermis culicivorax TaxID=13658 RepID=A0A915JFN2_ROMCU